MSDLTAYEDELKLLSELRHKREIDRLIRIQTGNLNEQDRFERACRENTDRGGPNTSYRRIGRFGTQRW